MNYVSKLILKDVRCFEGRKVFNIRPLTFLIGENSTGKSTVLGCFQTLSDFLFSVGFGGIDFNNAPYKMGAFRDIARKTSSLAEEFQLGFEIENTQYVLTLAAREDGSEPVIRTMELTFPDGVITVHIKRSGNHEAPGRTEEFDDIAIRQEGDNKFTVTIDPSRYYLHWLESPGGILDFITIQIDRKRATSQAYKNLIRYLKDRKNRNNHIDPFRPYHLANRTYSFAPVRSRPERTYDPLKETASPEGNEIPVFLMNLSTSRKEEWKHLTAELENFGKASGLFTSIGVRKLGRSTSDPFQLQVKVRGPKGNIVDAGYGISQILPILVRILTNRGSIFLLQQPEVHLHPRGQAELSTFLAKSVSKKEHSFLIETHSDYIIDRMRISVRDGIIKPNDISILYFHPEKTKGAVTIHNIKVDDQGNLIDTPEGYRDFFMKETDRLLGFA